MYLTVCITNEIYKHIEDNVLAEEYNSCRKGHQEFKKQLISDSMELKQAQPDQRIRKAFHIHGAPYSYLVHCFHLYYIHQKIIVLLRII